MTTKPFIVGITGGSGSGKTTFIRRIRAQFSASELCIISQDEYYRPLEEQIKDENSVENFDLPHSINDALFFADIQKLIAGHSVEKLEYIFNKPDVQPVIKIFSPAPIIVVEGLFVFHFEQLKQLFDLKVFFHAEDHLKLTRRILRDQIERGYPMDDVLYRFEHHVMPSFKKFIEPYMYEADVVINNNQNFEKGLDVICSYLRRILDKK